MKVFHLKSLVQKVLVLNTVLLTVSWQLNAQNLIELSNIKSREDLAATRAQLESNSTARNYRRATLMDSALWNGVLVTNVSLTDNEISMEIQSENSDGTKKLLALLNQQYKDDIIRKADWNERKYLVNSPGTDVELSMRIEEEEEVENNTASKLTITYNAFYNTPYANIVKNAVKNPEGLFYRLNLDYFGSNVEIFLNGISIFNGIARARYMNDDVVELNPFILEKGNVELKVLITPGLDEEGKPFPTIQKRSHVTAELQKGRFKNGEFQEVFSQKICDYNEYVTDTIVEDGRTRYSSYPGTYQYGRKQLMDLTNFAAEVGYTNKGWTTGNDLRNNKQLKEKVNALYQKLSKAIHDKDGDALSNLFLQMGTEQVAYDYGQNLGAITDRWELWMLAMDNTNVIKVETDFDIEISEDGKLIYASPNKQTDMLRAIGKETATGFTHYMYEDKTTNELKFIR